MSVRDEKVISQLKRLAAEYLNREGNGLSLITVLDVKLTAKGHQAIIIIGVLPDHQAEAALNFAKRRRTELKDYIQKHLRIKRVPHLDFALERQN
jgi:ribosome-binding factor A